MAMNRRTLLQGMACVGAATLTGPPDARASRPRAEVPPDARGMLYDTTLCIGCKACVRACKEANGLPPDTDTPGMEELWDAPLRLNATTKNIIELYKENGHRSYVKRQCMHCIDPACVGACMIGALKKREFGVVTWDKDRCIGCRYCQVACPFNIPKFEWEDRDPDIIKCEFCKDRPGDKKFVPACCEICPREAVIWGEYTELLEEAHRRLEAHPNRYVNKIYGEHDLGGTQVIYLSHVPFEKLGFELDDEEPAPELQQTIQHGIYKGFIAPAALYAILAGVMWRHRRTGGSGDDEAGREEASS